MESTRMESDMWKASGSREGIELDLDDIRYDSEQDSFKSSGTGKLSGLCAKTTGAYGL